MRCAERKNQRVAREAKVVDGELVLATGSQASSGLADSPRRSVWLFC